MLQEATASRSAFGEKEIWEVLSVGRFATSRSFGSVGAAWVLLKKLIASCSGGSSREGAKFRDQALRRDRSRKEHVGWEKPEDLNLDESVEEWEEEEGGTRDAGTSA